MNARRHHEAIDYPIALEPLPADDGGGAMMGQARVRDLIRAFTCRTL